MEKDGEGRYVLSLNKEFSEAGQPELIAKVIYVKNGSGIIQEYIRFWQVFDEQMTGCDDGQEKAKAIKEVLRICGEENILQDYLKQYEAELEKIMMTMVSPEYIEKAENRTNAFRWFIEGQRMGGHSEEEAKAFLKTKNYQDFVLNK